MPKANLPDDPPILPEDEAPIAPESEAEPSPPEPPAIAPVIQIARIRPPMQRYTGRVFDRRGNELTPEQIRNLYGDRP